MQTLYEILSLVKDGGKPGYEGLLYNLARLLNSHGLAIIGKEALEEIQRQTREDEREACAVLCDSVADEYADIYVDHRNQERQYIARKCARAIRIQRA